MTGPGHVVRVLVRPWPPEVFLTQRDWINLWQHSSNRHGDRSHTISGWLCWPDSVLNVNRASRMIWKSVVHIATASARSTNNQEEMSLLDIHYSILNSEPDDVRWEKLDHVRLMLADGTYRIFPEQVATKVIEPNVRE
jgi:anti-sigma28 factor (negative regulator of flagellin synthesis)